MSSFFAIVCDDTRGLEPELPERMLQSLALFGSDRSGLWQDQRAVLGQHLVISTPQARQEQTPSHKPQAKLSLAWDGRIDNRQELITQLGLRPHEQKDTSDASLILAAYEKWRERCVEKIVGDYALALWDAAQQQLFCARDSQGLRPLYYRYDHNQFLVASDPQALLEAKRMPTTLNLDHFEREILKLNRDHDSSYYQGIRRLRNGSALILKNGKHHCWRWWNPRQQSIRYASEQDYVEHYRELLQGAIRERMRSIGKLSADLSGGLDSSSVVCHGNQVLQAGLAEAECDTLQTYALALAEDDPWPKADERGRIDLVVDQETSEHHYIVNKDFQQCPVLDGQPDNYRSAPLSKSGAYCQTLQQRQAHGCKVNLLGQGGDETTTNQAGSIYFDLLYRGRLDLIGRDMYEYKRLHGSSLRHIINNRIITPMNWRINTAATLKQELAKRSHVATPTLTGKYNAELASSSQHIANTLPRTLAAKIYRSVVDTSYEAPILRHKLHGLDARMPMRDQRLVEFMIQTPAEIHRRGPWGRRMVRLAGEGVLPKGVQWTQDKFGSTQPDHLREVLANRERLLTLCQELEQIAEIRTRINFAYIREKISELPNTPNPSEHIASRMGKTYSALSAAHFIQRQGLV